VPEKLERYLIEALGGEDRNITGEELRAELDEVESQGQKQQDKLMAKLMKNPGFVAAYQREQERPDSDSDEWG
jgi:hypothetical protein